MSKADSQSNPTSDYDFGEIQDNSDDDELNMMVIKVVKITSFVCFKNS